MSVLWKPIVADTLHVVPLYGRVHEPEPTCWCAPRVVWQRGKRVWAHSPREVA